MDTLLLKNLNKLSLLLLYTDLVQGGVYSPSFLFDEQHLNIEVGEQATSNSWKPYYNDSTAPYYTIVDLGKNITFLK
jgi:hypothetical protein